LNFFKKTLDFPPIVCYNYKCNEEVMIIKNLMKGEKPMDKISKALKELAKAVEDNATVDKVDIKITLKKPKPSKAMKPKE